MKTLLFWLLVPTTPLWLGWLLDRPVPRSSDGSKMIDYFNGFFDYGIFNLLWIVLIGGFLIEGVWRFTRWALRRRDRQ